MTRRIKRTTHFGGMGILLALLSATVCARSADLPPAFEAADVRVSPRPTYPGFEGAALRGDRYILRHATLVDLIAIAYSVDAVYIVGGPIWLEADRFDITAKVPPTTSPGTMKLMLQSLLHDRFKLVIHTGSKPMPAFVLTTGNGKPKLKEAEGSGDADCKHDERHPGPGKARYNIYSCYHTTMDEFARDLQDWAGDVLTDPVVDSTGLKGSWDFDIKWTPEEPDARRRTWGHFYLRRGGQTTGVKAGTPNGSQTCAHRRQRKSEADPKSARSGNNSSFVTTAAI